MNRFIRIAAVLAAAAGLSATQTACADMVTGGPLIRPGEPLATLTVVNGSGHSIDAVLISACSASTYGLNRLPSGTAIPRGGRYDFTLSAGCWDVDAGAVGVGEARQRFNVQGGGVFVYTVAS